MVNMNVSSPEGVMAEVAAPRLFYEDRIPCVQREPESVLQEVSPTVKAILLSLTCNVLGIKA